jgi:hypothetical protein
MSSCTLASLSEIETQQTGFFNAAFSTDSPCRHERIQNKVYIALICFECRATHNGLSMPSKWSHTPFPSTKYSILNILKQFAEFEGPPRASHKDKGETWCLYACMCISEDKSYSTMHIERRARTGRGRERREAWLEKKKRLSITSYVCVNQRGQRRESKGAWLPQI